MKWWHRLMLRYWRWRVNHGGTDIARRELRRFEELEQLDRIVQDIERRYPRLRD